MLFFNKNDFVKDLNDDGKRLAGHYHRFIM